MNTVWSFGDSFATARGHFQIQYEDEWLTRVVRNLEDYNHYATAQSGTALEYTYSRFIDVIKDIQCNDIIIIAFTSCGRRWFWEDRPSEAAYIGYNPKASREENKALEYYEMYLNKNPVLHNTSLYYFLYCLNMITKAKNLKTIIIPSFDEIPNTFIEEFNNLHIANGFLLDVSKDEIDNGLDPDPFLRDDYRHNHIIASNHHILADKILDYITNGIDINLTEGFIKNVINYKILQDRDFTVNELFGNRWILN